MTNLIPFRELRSYTILSKDAEIGRLKDALFDPKTWEVKFFVTEAKKWLPDKKILISPHVVSAIRPETSELEVSLSKKDIEQAPSIVEKNQGSGGKRLDFYSNEFLAFDDPAESRSYDIDALWSTALPLRDLMNPVYVMPHGFTERWTSTQSPIVKYTDMRSCSELSLYVVKTADDETFFVIDIALDVSLWKFMHIVLSAGWWVTRPKICLPTLFVDEGDPATRTIETFVGSKTINSAPIFEDFSVANFNEKKVINHFFAHVGEVRDVKGVKEMGETGVDPFKMSAMKNPPTEPINAVDHH